MNEEKGEYEKLKSLLYTGTISQYGKRKLIDIIEKQQKVIDEMASYLSRIRFCPNADCGANIDCERRCNLTDEIQIECWKIYFNRRVEWNDR